MANTTKKTAEIGLKFTADKSDVKSTLQDIISQLDVIKDASAFDLKFKNIKGVSNLISSLTALDEKLNVIKSDSKTAGNGLSDNISGSTSKAVKDISLMSTKTSEFAQELSALANAGDITKVQDKVKQLAESINANLKMLNVDYQIDVDKLLNLGDAQQQIDMLSEGLGKFTAGWSTFGKVSIQATDELKSGLGSINNEIIKLKNRIQELKQLSQDFKTAYSAVSTYSDKGLSKEEMKNAEKFALDTKNMYQEANAQLKQVVPKSKEYYEILAKIAIAAGNMQKVFNSRVYKTFNDKELQNFYQNSNGASAIINAVHKWSKSMASRIQEVIGQDIASIEVQISNIDVSETPKLEKVKDTYKEVLDILNQIVAKEKEMQKMPEMTKNQEYVGHYAERYFDIKEDIDSYKEKIKEAFDEYYKAQNNLKTSKKEFKDFPDVWQNQIQYVEELKTQIAGFVVAAEDAGLKLEDVFSSAQLRTINAKNSGIQDLISQWREYELACDPVREENTQIESSIDTLRDKLLEVAKSANLSADAYNTIVKTLYSIDNTTGTERIEQIATTIDGLLTGKIEPEITKLKEQLNQLYPGKDFELKYIDIFNSVEESSTTAAQALEQIKKKEEEIAAKAKEREEAQRKANEEGSKPKPSSSTTPPSSGTGTGTGSGTGSSGTGTGNGAGPSSGEINDMNDLAGDVDRVKTSVENKTQAFETEKNKVKEYIDKEIEDLGRLESHIRQKTIKAINDKTQAFSDEKDGFKGVVDAEIDELGRLESKLEEVKNKIKSSSEQSDGDDKNKSQTTESTTPSGENDSALSSTLSNINTTLSTLNGTLEGLGKQDNTGKTQLEIEGFSDVVQNVRGIYGILNKGDGENQALAKSVNSAVEALSNASKAIAEDAKQRATEKKQSANKTTPETINAKATNRASLASINGVVKATQKQYESFSGTNEVPDRLKSDYAGLLSIIEDVRKANRAYSQEEINEIDKICRGIQDEIGLLKAKKDALSEQQSLSKKYTINTDDLFDTSKKGNIVGSGYEDKIKGIVDEINAEVSKLKQIDDDGNIKILDASEIENSKNRLKELNAELQSTIKEARNASKGSFTKTYENQLGKVSAALKNFKTLTSDMNLDNSITNTITKYETALTKLNEIKTKLEQAPKGSDTSELTYQWGEALKEAQRYEKQLKNIIDTSQKIENGTSIFDINKDIDVNNIEQVRSAIESYVQSIAKGKATIDPFDYENKELTATFVDENGMIQKVTVSYDQLNHVVGQSITPVQKATTGWEKLTATMGKKVREMASYFATFGSVYQVINVIKQGIAYVKEIDLALTELKKVTDATEQQYAQFLQTMSKTASVVGSTVKDLTNSAADWSRLGYSMQEAGELAATTAKLLNVSEFESVDDATSALVSALQAFTEEGQDVGQRAEEIVDILNNIGNKYPVATNELAQGLETSAAALVAANNSIEEQVALLSAGNATMQDVSVVASGLKIVAARLRGTTTDIDEDADSAITNVSKLQSKIKALTAEANGGEGIDIINEQGDYKSTYEILKEISKIFDKMDDVSQASLLELIAGKNRSSVVAAILQNTEILEDAYNDALNSAGSATNELNTYMNSIQGRIDQFTNALQTMWKNFISSDMVKFFVDLGTSIIKVIDKIGVLKSTLIALVSIKALPKLTKSLGFTNLISDIYKTTKAFTDFTKASNAANAATLAQAASQSLAKSSLVQLAIQLGIISAEEVATASATTLLSASFKAFGASILGTIKMIGAFIMATPLKWILLAGAAVTALVVAFDALTTSHKEYVEQLKETSQEIENLRSNIDSLNSELEATKSRIEELENKGPLTLTEQEELDKLKAQNAELERQIQLEEAREERARNKQAEEAKGAYESDNDFKAQMDPYTGVYMTNKFEQNLDAIEKAKEDLNDAEIALQDALNSGMDTNSKKFKKLEDNLESAQEDYTEAQSNWDEFYKNKQEEYSGLEWFDGDNLTEAQKKVNEILSTMKNYSDRAEILFGSAGAKESALNRLFGERGSEAGKAFNEAFNAKIESGELKVDAMAFDNTSLEEAKEYYDEVMSEVEQKGIDITKTMYGNIDMNNRQVLYWTQENLDKYKDAIESWGETIDSMGDYSTVFGGSENFDGIEIAFTPMLQTENGAIFLDKNTVYKYVYGLIDKAKENGEEPTLDVLLQLDKEGLEFNGQQIKNMIADVGETAIKTGEAMHYVGDIGAVENAKKALDEAGGSFEDVVKSAEDMINASPQLKLQLDSLGISAEDVARYFLDINNSMQQTEETVSITITDLASLTSAYESYVSVLQMANEAIFEGQAISEDYYTSLKEYLGDVTVGEEDFSDAIDTTNGYVVKNTKLLKSLITQKKKEQKATVSAAKAQSQLQYVKLTKQLQQEVAQLAEQYKANKAVTLSTVQNIAALRSQVNAIKTAVREYAILELKLSDVTNAYNEFEEAKNRDAELSYGDSMIEMLETISDGLLTGKVGTESFKAAVKALVPESVIADCETFEERLDAIDNYFENSKFADYFTIDEDGNFSIALKNIEAFIADAKEAGAFLSNADGTFTIADNIQDIEDLADAMGLTKEATVAMVTELSKYDASWGNIVADLTMTPLDRTIRDTTDALDQAIAKQEQFFKDGKNPYGDGQDEYLAIQTEINNCSDALNKAQQAVINNTNSWIDATNKVDTAKEKVATLTRELQQLKDSGATDSEIQIKTDQLENATKELSDALQIKYNLQEPTQMDFQIALGDIQEEIDKWKEENATLVTEVVPKLKQDENGTWKIPAEAEVELNEEDKQKIQAYIDLLNDEEQLKLFTSEEIDPVVDEITQVKDVLDNIYKVVESLAPNADTSGLKEEADKTSNVIDSITSTNSIGNSEAPKSAAASGSITKNNTSTSTSSGFDSDAIDQHIEAWNTMIDGWAAGLEENIEQFKEALVTFFQDTLPEKWNEFWDGIGEKLDDIDVWAQNTGQVISKFFDETLPEKWNAFWEGVGEKLDDIDVWAQNTGQVISKFFDETLPEAWNNFWEGVGEFLKSTPYTIGYFTKKVRDFFTVTLPEKWNEFWEGVGEKLDDIDKWAQDVGKVISKFFDETLPEKWNEFWDGVSTFITETIPEALSYIWGKVVEFFTVTIPEKWNSFWDSVSEYVSTNITPALTEIWNKVVEFFTVTIPEKLNQFWDDIVTFVTETVPTAIENAKEGVTTFFTETIPGKINELWDGIASWIVDKATSFWNFLKSGFTSGYEDAANGKDYNPSGSSSQQNRKSGNTIYAKGSDGLKTSEHNAIVGELGPETVVDVDKGVYYTVGDNGTEMVDLPKNAIIYNHKQTEVLFKNGKTSRGTPTSGLSFAHGNAHWDYGLYTKKTGTSAPAAWGDGSDKTWAQMGWDLSGAAGDLSDAANSLSDSSDDMSDAFEDTIDWIEVLFTRIDNILSEHEAYFATVIDSTGGLAEKNSIYNTMFGQMYYKANKSIEAANWWTNKANELMSTLPSDIQNKIRNGTIDVEEFEFNKSTAGLSDEEAKAVEKEREAYEEYVNQINEAIDAYNKISEYKQQYYSTLEEIADKSLERQEETAKAYENEIGLTEHLNETLEARNDLLEAKEGFASEAYYKAQINASNTMLKQYQAERKALQQVLDEEVAAGRVQIGDQQWFDMQENINDCDDAIIDMEASIEDLQNAINDLYWDRFDELINRFGYLEDEISNVIELLSHDRDGLVMEELRDLTTTNWATGSGLASLGLYAQQMEEAQYVANQYAEQIKELKKQYAAGRYNETEYLNKLNELISAQYENIEKYYDAKDAIIELNEARVDAIRDGIEKEIDAYDELIQKKKDLLSREQDLHDFQDEVAEKEKDVSDLRKQLAAMAGDTTAATTAKRKQLEAQLVEAEKALEDSYYSHSMNAREEALDKEFSDFEEEKNAEIEKWQEWLSDTESVVSESLEYVKANTNEVFNTLKDLGNDYNLTMSDSLITPWQNGSNAIDSYSENFETATSNFTKQLDAITLHWEDVTAAAEEAAAAQAKALQTQYNKTVSNVPSTITGNTGSTNNNTPKPTTPTPVTQPIKKTITTGSKVKVSSTDHIYGYNGSFYDAGKQYYRNDPIYIVIGEKDNYYKVRYHKLSSGVTGWFKKSQVSAYAKGLKKAEKDQIALINELGPELQLVPGRSGNLEAIKYGTSIIPADLSEKIMDLALDPASIFDDVKSNVKVPNIETKDFNFEFNFENLLHVDNATNDSIPTLKKMIRTEFNELMSSVNQKLKRV